MTGCGMGRMTATIEEFAMFQPPSRYLSRLIIALAVALLATAGSHAQDFSDRDTREISSYVLTEAGLAKYSQATRNLDANAKKSMSAGACEDDGAASLDAAVARIDAIPSAKAAIKAAGMTTREYLLFTWSVFQNGMAAWAVSQPGGKLPPGASMANVNFYRTHEAALKKLGQTASGDCADDGGGDDGGADDGMADD